MQLFPGDMQHCCYISGGKSVLVKFNSVQTRDNFMFNYVKKGRIFLKDIMTDCLVNSRVYINDHLTQPASRLVYTCRNLLRKKVIKKFKLINGDEPEVNVVFPDVGETTLDYDHCVGLSTSYPAHVGTSSGGGVVAPSAN